MPDVYHSLQLDITLYTMSAISVKSISVNKITAETKVTQTLSAILPCIIQKVTVEFLIIMLVISIITKVKEVFEESRSFVAPC